MGKFVSFKLPMAKWREPTPQKRNMFLLSSISRSFVFSWSLCTHTMGCNTIRLGSVATRRDIGLLFKQMSRLNLLEATQHRFDTHFPDFGLMGRNVVHPTIVVQSCILHSSYPCHLM